MYKKFGFLPILIVLALVFLSGCTSSGSDGIPIVEENETLSAEETAYSLITGDWSADDLMDGAFLTYYISPEGVLDEKWVFNGTWTNSGESENGTISYPVVYNDGTIYTYYLLENGSVFYDGYDNSEYEKQNGTAIAGGDPVVGTWVYLDSDCSGSITFNADGTIDELWEYQGTAEYDSLSENGDYIFNVVYPVERWDFTLYLSSDGKSLTDLGNITLSKV